MIRSVKVFFLAGSLAYASFAQSAPAAPPTPASEDNKAGAYYNFAMGRLYAELAAAEGSPQDVTKAIHYYQEAIKLEPKDGLILEELTDLYIKTNRLADAVDQAEGLLKLDPNNLDARRTLAQIYTHLAIGDTPNAKIDDNYLHKAIEQYRKVTELAPKDVESWSYLGKLYRASSDSAAAEKAFNSALQAEPDNEDALMGLAAIYADLGDSAKALEKLKTLTDKSPNERTLGILAQQYESMNDFKSAADALERAVGLDQDDERLEKELALDLFRSGQLDESLKVYQQLASDNPREPFYRLWVARVSRYKHDFPAAEKALATAQLLDADNLDVRDEQVYLLDAEGKTAEAISAMKSILDTLPRRNYSRDPKTRADLMRHLAIVYRDAKQYPAAVDAFRQYATLDTDDDTQADAAVQIVETYLAAGDPAAAEREAQASLKKLAENRGASRGLQLALAQVYEQGKRWNDMIKALDRAGQLASTDSEKLETTVQIVETYRAAGDLAAAEREVQAGIKKFAGNRAASRELHLELAEVYEQGKRWDDMMTALDRADQFSTTDGEKEQVNYMRGVSLERQKKYDQSEAAFRKVLEMNPKNALALNYLGYTLADRNVRLEEAYDLIKRAVDLDPENGAYLDSLGWVYFRQGKLDDARGLLERALDRMQDPTVHDHLGDVYLKLGKTKEAIAQWQDSLREFQKAAQPQSDPEEMASVNRKLDEAQAKLAAETHNK
ncbi:MAG: tetratricopeptide repeat protein [Bryobacteraceae bacterium]